MEFLIVLILLMGVALMIIQRIGKLISKGLGFSSHIVGLKHVSGVPFLEEGSTASIGVRRKKNEIQINDSHLLPLQRVKRAEYKKEHQLVETHKNAIQKAVSKGVLLGSLSPLVSAMSGHGIHKQEDTLHFLAIDFIDRENQPQTALFLLTEVSKGDIWEFVDDVNKRVGYVPEQNGKPDHLNPYRM